MVDQKLLDSIKQYLDQGADVSSLKISLMSSGWSENDVDSAIEKITGKKLEEKKAEEKKPEAKKPFDKKKLFLIAGIVLIVLSLAALTYFFVLKVGFSEDIPDGFKPLGKLDSFLKEKMSGYNKLALGSVSPLKDVIQNGKINLIMTNSLGTKIIDVTGIVVENGQIVSTSLKVDDPSFDIKFSESTFDEMMKVNDPKPLFLKGYAQGSVKIKAYDEENEKKLSLLDSFVNYFFTF